MVAFYEWYHNLDVGMVVAFVLFMVLVVVCLAEMWANRKSSLVRMYAEEE